MSHPNFCLTGPAQGDSEACEAILRSLPQWFGIEAAIVQYAKEVATLPTFSAIADARTVGFLALKEHFAESAEIHVMAVRPQWRGQGVGKALMGRAETWLKGRGVRLLQVKTLSESRPDSNYEKTRGFYRKLGFLPLEEFPKLWSEANPCLVLVKPLSGP